MSKQRIKGYLYLSFVSNRIIFLSVGCFIAQEATVGSPGKIMLIAQGACGQHSLPAFVPALTRQDDGFTRKKRVPVSCN